MQRLYKLIDYYEKAPFENPEIIGYYGSLQDAIKAKKEFEKITDGECKLEIHHCL